MMPTEPGKYARLNRTYHFLYPVPAGISLETVLSAERTFFNHFTSMVELLKIDPYLETVYPVAVSDSLADVCRQISARRLSIAGQQAMSQTNSCPDAAYCDEEALYTDPLPPAFCLRTTGHVIYGCALWHRVTEGGQLRP